MSSEDLIYVTEPFLPPLEEFIPYVEKIWKSKILTNSGQFHQELESQLCDFLGVPYISLFNNATNGLLTALQALDLKGEVITTPFTFLATATSLLWNNLDPVFVDIDERNLNIDPKLIEAAITEKTTAILGVHCYGNICDVEAIERIAKKHNLKVIYDAAHAFGVNDKFKKSIMNCGDLSVISFHATKVFNTFEGGAVVSHSKEMKLKIDSLKNFGIESETVVNIPGLNGKLNEISSALGLVQIKYMDQIKLERKRVYDLYTSGFAQSKGIQCMLTHQKEECDGNYAYFPVLVKDEYGISRDELHQKLKDNGIIARKYFYPILTDFKAFKYCKVSGHLNNSKDVANRVLCLPIYPNLKTEDVVRIIKIITS